MRTTITFFCAFLVCAIAWGQQEDAPNRTVTMTILNNRERPVRNIAMVSVNTGKVGMTNRSGLFVFEDIPDNDSIFIHLTRNSLIKIPVTGMDSIVVTAKTSRLYSYTNSQGYEMNAAIIQSAESGETVLDVPNILSKQSYRSLIDLLQGHVAGFNITMNTQGASGTGTMRGPTSLYGSGEPIVVMDGVILGSLSQANFTVNIYNVKTIAVEKNASQWGVQGANGVILVNTQ